MIGGHLRALARPALLSVCLLSTTGNGVLAEPADVSARPISAFRLGSVESRFGKLEFLGGLVLDSSNPLFGSLSSIRVLPDGRSFLSVLDTGHWLTGRIERDAAGRLAGLSSVRITSMRDDQGRVDEQKYNMDSEGLALRGDQVLVSFERRHRVDVYPAAGLEESQPVGRLPILIPPENLRGNGSLETVVVGPPGTPLAGATVIVAERSVDEKGRLYAAVLDGPLQGRFSVVPSDGFAVSDGTFLPSGDLLLLERRFNIATGAGFRILRFKGAEIRQGAVLTGDVVIDADMSEQIDNMEGIDAVIAADGSIHLLLVSDDNHSIFQRSLMLEFRLAE